jgi:hypothetical protein
LGEHYQKNTDDLECIEIGDAIPPRIGFAVDHELTLPVLHRCPYDDPWVSLSPVVAAPCD